MGVYILGLGARNIINRAYAYLSAMLSLWMLSIVLLWLPMDTQLREIIAKAQPCLYLSIGILTLNFTHTFLRRRRDSFFFSWIGVYFIFAMTAIFTDLVTDGYRTTGWGISGKGGLLFRVSLIMNAVIPGIRSLMMLWKKRRITKDLILRKQLFFIILGTLISLPASFMFFMPLSSSISGIFIKEIAPAMTISHSIFIFIAVARWRFLYTRISRASQEIFANIDKGIILLDGDDTPILVNEYAMNLFGAGRDEMSSFRIERHIPEYEYGRQYSRYETAINSGDVVRHIELTQSTITHRNFSIGTLIIIGDITENRNTMDRLREAMKAAQSADRAKTTFLAGMTHELRTPLNSIIGFSQLLIMEGKNLSGEQVEYIQTINGSGRHLLAMVNDVLDQSRIDSGTVDIRKEKFDIKTMLSQFPLTLKPLIDEKSLVFQLDIDKNVGIINADVLRINQIIYNLLSNAIKFTDSGKNIGLRARGNKDSIIIEVWDEGPGIKRHELERIFQPFVQLGDHEKRIQGSGLGLSITKYFVRLHDGTLDVESVPGRGSNFIVTLPGRMKDKRSKSRVSGGNEDPGTYRARKSISILVVEDNPVNSKLADSILKKMGHRVETVSTGEKAVSLALEGKHELIVIDIQLPGMDGTSAMRTIRESRPALPIIALTASLMQEETENLLLAGFDAHITKPISFKLLYEVIDSLTNRETITGKGFSAEQEQSLSSPILAFDKTS
jgi:signal transduction histidine kinase/CheY-like chemotaxis protein